MGSVPRFGSGVVCQAVRPLFSWGSCQTETKRAFSRMSLGNPRTSPPRIQSRTEGTRSISMGYAVHRFERRQLLWKPVTICTPTNPFKPTRLFQPHDGHLISFLASRSVSVLLSGVSRKTVSRGRNDLTGSRCLRPATARFLDPAEPRNPNRHRCDRAVFQSSRAQCPDLPVSPTRRSRSGTRSSDRPRPSGS